MIDIMPDDKEISKEVFKLVSKPFISPLIYRFAGRILQNKTIKNIGKDAFFAKPFPCAQSSPIITLPYSAL